MDDGLRTGLFFGLTSGVITTLGLIAGLHSGTQSLAVVLNGILVIAIADSMSDALGVHISKEAEPGVSSRTVWGATIWTLIAKVVVTLSFLIPVIMLSGTTAIVIAIVWGFAVLAVLSYFLARWQGGSVILVTAEHLSIAAAVVIAANWVGGWAGTVFL